MTIDLFTVMVPLGLIFFATAIAVAHRSDR